MRRSWALGVCVLAVSLVVVAGCKGAETREPEFVIPNYSDATQLKAVGTFDGAIAEYEAYLAANKDSVLAPYAAFHIAECHLQMRNVDQAKAQYNKVIKSYAGSVPAGWAKEDLEFLANHPEIMIPPAPAPPAAPGV